MITITGKKFDSSNMPKFDQQQAYQFVFCKFEQVLLNDIKSPYLEFLGCFFDTVTLQNVEVQEINFLACLGHEESRAIKITNCTISRVQAIYSNICLSWNGTLEKWQYGEQRLIPDFLELFNSANYYRPDDLSRIADENSHGVMIISSISIMLDTEWDMRTRGLAILNKLGQHGFDIAHSIITNFLISFLDDEHPFVVDQVRLFIRDHHINEQRVVEVFRDDIQKIFSSKKEDVLKSIKLLLKIIRTKSLDKKTVIDLISPIDKFINHVNASDKELRLGFYEFIDKMDNPKFNDIVVAGLNDIDNEIKLASLNLVYLLTQPPSLKNYVHLFEDKEETVRAEAFTAAISNGDFNTSIVQEYVRIEKSEFVLQEIQNMLS
ncbi:MAG: hypothetical protein MUC49_14165 [Raineya sp.]|jgi:hypothetical protein|nr:hypothetical protein [Raineya sp.]